jgi:hypothetical protein
VSKVSKSGSVLLHQASPRAPPRVKLYMRYQQRPGTITPAAALQIPRITLDKKPVLANFTPIRNALQTLFKSLVLRTFPVLLLRTGCAARTSKMRSDVNQLSLWDLETCLLLSTTVHFLLMTQLSVHMRLSSMAQNASSFLGTLHNERMADMMSIIHFCLDYATQHLALYTGQLQR